MTPINVDTTIKKVTHLSLRRKIRHAVEPDNPLLIDQLLKLKPDSWRDTLKENRAHQLTQFRLLMDTITDDYLPPHWRCQCLDYIYRPLHELQKLADCKASKDQILILKNELRIMSHYFQAGINDIAGAQPQHKHKPSNQEP